MRKMPLVLVLLCLSACGSADVTGRWEGTAAVFSMEMNIAVDVQVRGDSLFAQLDMPDIGEAHIPMTKVQWDGQSLTLVLDTGMGRDTFDLTLHRRELQGTWQSVLAPETATVSLRPVKPAPRAFQEEDVRFTSGEVVLAGTLLVPIAAGRHPAIVFVHGSGPETRHATRFLAERFARAGVAALSYDKRGVGESGGDWMTSDFDDLARDAVAAVAMLRGRDDIDSTRIGLRGQSQGGWVAPLAATLDGRVAAVIIVSGSLATPAVQGHWETVYALRAAGFGATEIARARRVLEAQDDATRTGDWSGFQRAVSTVREEPWFSHSHINPDPDVASWFWPWFRRVMDYDPVPVIDSLAVPLLAIVGEDDEYVNARHSAEVLTRHRERSGAPVSVVTFAGAGHSLRVGPRAGQPFRWATFPDGYVESQIDWFTATVGLATQ